VSADHTYLNFNPVDFSLVGTYRIEIILSDGQPLSTRYPLTVTVTNTPPYFNLTKPVTTLELRFN
jgi:hypothetical protein